MKKTLQKHSKQYNQSCLDANAGIFRNTCMRYFLENPKNLVTTVVIKLIFKDIKNSIERSQIIKFNNIPTLSGLKIDAIENKTLDIVNNIDKYIDSSKLTKQPQLVAVLICFNGYIDYINNKIYRAITKDINVSDAKSCLIFEVATILNQDKVNFVYLNPDNRLDKQYSNRLHEVETPAIFAQGVLNGLKNYF